MPLEHTSARDVYLRHTDKDGRSYVREHRVWDADKFIASQLGHALKEGGKAFVQQLTREQYNKERKGQ